MNFLITGTSSGLGRYAFEVFGGTPWTRRTDSEDFARLRRQGVDVILHCAANAARPVAEEALFGYLGDNVLLTERLVSIPHRKFVFMSSIDVYPKSGKKWRESDSIPLERVSGPYAMTKLMSEAIVRSVCDNFLILRAASLLGPYSRRNTAIRLAEGSPLSLSEESSINCILQSDLLDFIQTAVDRDLQGVFNAASSANLSLREAAALFGGSPRFSSHRYDTGRVDNHKIASISPAFRKTTREVLRTFFRQNTAQCASRS